MTLLMPRAEPVPIEVNEQGVARVGGTRVTLDTVIGHYKHGDTPEDIVRKYPTVTLADAYAVIAYYLRATDEVEAYLHEREQRAAEVRRENEARFDPEGVRERLLARRKKQE